MEATILALWANLLAANLGLTLVSLLIVVGHFWLLLRYIKRSLQELSAGQERIAAMVHELRQRP